MRPIHIAHLDKAPPVLIMPPDLVRTNLRRVTVAPITSTVRGLSTEVPVGTANGVDHHCVVSCDHLVTVPNEAIGRQVGYLLAGQEAVLAEAVRAAFDVD